MLLEQYVGCLFRYHLYRRDLIVRDTAFILHLSELENVILDSVVRRALQGPISIRESKAERQTSIRGYPLKRLPEHPHP